MTNAQGDHAAAVTTINQLTSEQTLFRSHRLTPRDSFTAHIEGPAVDSSGNLYAVNFQENGTIGRLAPDAAAPALFATLPTGSIGNGIRFDRQGCMFIADYKAHNVFVIEPGHAQASVYFQADQFHQPNDLAIASEGTLYASDPSFTARTGQIWRITRGVDGRGHGVVMTSSRQMGVTNGIDLSPDERTLYVSESNSQEIWAYHIDADHLVDPQRVTRLEAPEVDGLRTDAAGRIFIARPSRGEVTILNPDGTRLQSVPTLGREPTNLTFGGPDGKSVLVTQKDGKFIEGFRTDQPGREHRAS